MSTRWIEYRREVCPICGHKGWCRKSPNGELIRCQRVQSDWKARPDGWIHWIDGQPHEQAQSFAKREQEGAELDCKSIMQRYMLDTTTIRLERLSRSLGVSVESLRRLNASWSVKHEAWAFPMRDQHNSIIGIRLRNESGAKWAIKGSRQGLFIPQPVIDEQKQTLLICEGPTEAGALLDEGFDVIGRPSCMGCDREIAAIVRARHARPIIAANFDEPKKRPDGTEFFPGQDGAEALAKVISTPTKIIYPPRHKDYRAWKNSSPRPIHDLINLLIQNARFVCRQDIGLLPHRSSSESKNGGEMTGAGLAKPSARPTAPAPSVMRPNTIKIQATSVT